MRYWFRCLTLEYSWVKCDTNKLKSVAITVFSGFSWHVTTVPQCVQNETLLKKIHVFQTKHPRFSGNGTQSITSWGTPLVNSFLPSGPPFLSLFLSAFMQHSCHPKLSPISSVWAGPSNIFLIQFSFVRPSLFLQCLPCCCRTTVCSILKESCYFKVMIFYKPQGEQFTQKGMSDKLSRNERHYEYSSGCFNPPWAPN